MTERMRERATMDAIAGMLRRKEWHALLQHWSQSLDQDDRWYLATMLRQFRAYELPSDLTFEFECLKLESALRLGISSLVEIHLRGLMRLKDPSAEQQALVDGYVARVMESPAASVSFRAQLKVSNARKYGSPDACAEALYECGRVSLLRGQLGRAETAFLQAWAFYEQASNVQRLADVLVNLGVLRRANMQLNEAVESFDYARQYYEQITNIAGQVTALRELGYTYRLLEDAERARQCFQQSYDLCELSQDEAQRALALLGLADVWGSIGRYDMAEQSLKFAMFVYEKLDHAFGLADVLLGLAQVKLLTGMVAEAHEYLARLRTLVGNSTDPAIRSAFTPTILDALEKRLPPLGA
jgi:tetratricopeptide (TPR) repeat protein